MGETYKVKKIKLLTELQDADGNIVLITTEPSGARYHTTVIGGPKNGLNHFSRGILKARYDHRRTVQWMKSKVHAL